MSLFAIALILCISLPMERLVEFDSGRIWFLLHSIIGGKYAAKEVSLEILYTSNILYRKYASKILG